jgi:hypothetical protein
MAAIGGKQLKSISTLQMEKKKLKSISMQHILVHATCTASKQLE